MTAGGRGKVLPQIIYALIAAGGALVAGTVLGWSSQIESNIITDGAYGFKVTDSDFSWFSSISNLGAFATCIPTGIFTNIVGRKLVIIALALPMILGWGLVTFATNVAMLLAGRFFLGMGAGGFCVACPMYTGEIASKHIRGTLGSFFQLMVTVGILWAYVFGAYLNLKAYNSIGFALPIVFIVAFFFIPETPAYLVSKNKESEAIKSIERLRGSDFDYRPELQELKTEDAKVKSSEVNVLQAITKPVNMKSTFIGIGLMFFQQLSGINAVIFFSGTIIEDADAGITKELGGILIGVVQVVATLISVLIVDKAGRKLLLIISAVLMSLCTIALGVFFYLKENDHSVDDLSWLPLSSLIIFIVMFSLGFGPVPWMMMGELFSPEIKSVSSSLAGSSNWLLAFCVTKAYGPAKDAWGAGPVFWIFSGISLIGGAFVLFFCPETKGKSLPEIQELLGAKRSSPNNKSQA